MDRFRFVLLVIWSKILYFVACLDFFCLGIAVGLGLDFLTLESSLLVLP
jgi:hypothetical protein